MAGKRKELHVGDLLEGKRYIMDGACEIYGYSHVIAGVLHFTHKTQGTWKSQLTEQEQENATFTELK